MGVASTKYSERELYRKNQCNELCISNDKNWVQCQGQCIRVQAIFLLDYDVK